MFLRRNDGKNSQLLISVTAGQRFRRELEEEAIFCRGQELIEEVRAGKNGLGRNGFWSSE
jgi:hypothetical protein